MNKNLKGGLFAAGKPKPLEPSESTVSKSIEGFLNSQKIKNYRLNAGKIKQTDHRGNDRWIHLLPKGTPNRVFFVEGAAYFVEVKMKNKKPTAEQIEEHRDLRTRGGCVVFVADSIDNFIVQFNRLFPERAVKIFIR